MGIKDISPIDGRYKHKIKELEEYYSEYALIRKRIYVELMYLKELGKGSFLEIYDSFDEKEAKKVKKIEKETNHDVKAVEYYLRGKVPEKVREFVHYGLTSEDVNNLAYSLLIKEFLEEYYYNKLQTLLDKLHSLSLENKSLSVLARTHGQPASPTTLGKEFFVFFSRINDQFEKIKKLKLRGKLNGATGNYNALYAADPSRNWIGFSKSFVESLGLDVTLITTQIEPKDTLVELFHNVKRINNIVLDLDRDVWLYILQDYFKLKRKKKEVGSSTMPHKVNPIDFENSEGNIKIANSLITGLENLQISRLQRDLSDSTMMRNVGVMFSHSVLAYDSTFRGLNKLIPNEDVINKEMESHPEVLTEAIQTVLRKSEKHSGYEILKDLSRGKVIELDDLHEFIDSLDLNEDLKDKLKKLRVKDYTGIAEDLVK